MNPHLPYILGAYSIFTVVMLYCAVMPVIRGRKVRRLITRYHRNRRPDESHT